MLYYNSAKTGVIDGFIIFPSAVKGMKYPEAAPNLTITGFGAQYAAALLVNKSAWSKLPAALQKILQETALEWGAKADAMMQGLGEAGVEAAKGFPNAHVFVLPREEQDPVAQLATQAVSRSLGRRIVLVFGDADLGRARTAAAS